MNQADILHARIQNKILMSEIAEGLATANLHRKIAVELYLKLDSHIKDTGELPTAWKREIDEKTNQQAKPQVNQENTQWGVESQGS